MKVCSSVALRGKRSSPNIQRVAPRGQQARTLGEYFADTHFTAIYTSDLKRAFTTAQVLCDHQRDPRPSFLSSLLLREQNFGRAEGIHSSLGIVGYPGLTWEENAARGVYLAMYDDDDRFPEGESIKDLAERARSALANFVLPHVWQAAKEGKTGIHIAIVSHGLCINELISDLLKRSAKKLEGRKIEYSHLWNTSWTRVVIDIEVGSRETWCQIRQLTSRREPRKANR